MISWQTAAHWPYVEAPFPFYLVFYDRGRAVGAELEMGTRRRSGTRDRRGERRNVFYSVAIVTCLLAV